MQSKRRKQNYDHQRLGIIMKKLFAIIMLFGFTSMALASDYVVHHNNKSIDIPTQANQIQILNFWAAWCGPCRREMPDMNKWYLQKGKKQNIAMIGIAIDHEQNITNFLKTTPVNYPIWRYTGKDSRKLLLSYGNKLGGFPFTVVRMNGCETTWTTVGELTIDRLEQSIAGVKKACIKT